MEQEFLLNEDMLWDYADGFLSREEKMRVDEYLHLNPEYRRRLDAILAEKKSLAALPLDRPSTGFADRVMAAWVAEQTGNRQGAADRGKDWIIYAIAGVMGVFILLPILLILFSAGSIGPAVIPQEYIPPAQSIPWGEIFTHPAMRFGLPLALLFVSFRFLDQYLHQKKLLVRLQA